jgi:hypothetical protein
MKPSSTKGEVAVNGEAIAALDCVEFWTAKSRLNLKESLASCGMEEIDVSVADSVRLAWREGETACLRDRGEEASTASTSTDVAVPNEAGFILHKVIEQRIKIKIFMCPYGFGAASRFR